MDKIKTYAKQFAIFFFGFCLGVLAAMCLFVQNTQTDRSEDMNQSTPALSDLDTAPSESSESEDHPIIVQLDDEYASALAAAFSNVEICDVNARFAESWMQKTEEYYTRLLDICPENMQAQIESEKEEWLRYSQLRIDLELEYLQQIYGSGTIVPVILSRFTYDLYREKAVELIEIHAQLEQILEDHSIG